MTRVVISASDESLRACADHLAHKHILVDDVVAHIGLGSDFDGVTTLPAGLNDASLYPNLIYALLKKGYTEVEIAKILGGNALRVWREVERVAASS